MAEKNVTLFINGVRTTVSASSTVMQAADAVGISIPRLCYHPSLSVIGACRVCIVEVEGQRNPVVSCAFPVQEGMKVNTSSPLLRRLRRDIVELILDNHPQDCQTCERNGTCELQKLAFDMGVKTRMFAGERKRFPVDDSSLAVIRNPEKCILCGRCVRVCDEVQGVHNLSQQKRGFKTVVAPAHCQTMLDSVCIQCGQCVNVCPTAAFVQQDDTEKIFEALSDPTKHVVVQTAPAIRATIGEGFGYAPGTPVTGKLVTALRMMGFAKVFDTNFGADLTIIEEATELLGRLQRKENLPLITSCSPGWIGFLEKFHPELIPNTSSCKSPMSMLSALIKTYYADQASIDPKNIFVVAVMPCTAKKFERSRPEHQAPWGAPYTDAVVTTRELVRMMKCMGIDFRDLNDGVFDTPLGMSSGAGDIFGATGGVMEAALRTAYEKLTGQTCPDLDFVQVRGVQGVKEASLEIAGMTVNIGVANGLHNAKTLLDKVQSGEKQFHLIEIMACPGGCVAGGGQPYPPAGMHVLDPELARLRAKALYSIDRDKSLRRSHDNQAVITLYEEFLGGPNSHLAHELLHTHYQPKFPRGVV
jgi:NADP-reducing hydrogenase subunit HndD